MGTLFSTLRTQMRTRLGETSALEWQDSTLLDYLLNAEVWLARTLAKIRNSGRFQYQEEKTLASGATTIAATTLTKRYDVLRKLEFQLPVGWWEVIPEIPEMQENLWQVPSTAPVGNFGPIGYLIRDDVFTFLPVASGARVVRFTYNWLPATGKTAASTADTPDQYDDLLILRAIHYALADVGETNKSFEDEYASRIAEMEEIESYRSHAGGGERTIMASGLF